MKKIINKSLSIYKSHEEVFNYLIIGFLTTVVNLVTKYILLFTIFDASNPTQLQITIIISWIVAVLFAYVTNRKIVFKSKEENIIKELFKFVEARIATLLFEMIYMWFFVTLLKLDSDLFVIIWTASCQFLVIVFNYIFSKLFVFKNKKEKI